MKNLFKTFIAVCVLTVVQYDANAQCTACNFYVGADPGGGAVLYTGQDLGTNKLCILANASNISLGNNANGWSLCIAPGVTFTQNNFSFQNGGSVQVFGTFDAGTLDGNGTKSITIESGGTMEFSGSQIQNVNITNNGSLILDAAGQQSLQGNSTVITNNGTITKSSGLLLIGGSSTLANTGTVNLADFENADAFLTNATDAVINISGNYFHHGGLLNDGAIYANTITVGDKNFVNINNGLFSAATTFTFGASNNRFENNGGVEAGTSFTIINSKDFAPSTGYVYSPSLIGVTPALLDGNIQFIDLATLEASSFPIKLREFRAKQLVKSIELTWKVSDGVNFEKFEIEKSSNAKSFERLGKVNYDQKEAYSFLDNNPYNGINYYRLRLLDFDGKINFSNIISVEYSEGSEYLILENPAKGQMVSVKTNVVDPKIKVYDLLGKEVSFKTIKNQEGFDLIPKKYVYDVLILSVKSEKNNFSRRVVLQD